MFLLNVTSFGLGTGPYILKESLVAGFWQPKRKKVQSMGRSKLGSGLDWGWFRVDPGGSSAGG